jgi:ferric-dicitrate binding protein FerR (iron transport regulator)
MKAREKSTNKEAEDMALFLSGEKNESEKLPESYSNKEDLEILNYLNKMKSSRGEDNSRVDIAWEKLVGRLQDDNLLTSVEKRPTNTISMLLRVAAFIVIAIGLTFSGRYLLTNNIFVSEKSASTTAFEKNIKVELPDGSSVYLNRSSELIYPSKFEKDSRVVRLVGEAFFDITPNANKPFVVNVGDAKVTVLGTSFNVISDNGESEVEVMVQTGKVALSSFDGELQVTLEPGIIGTIGSVGANSFSNSDPNYLSWNTEVLSYNGTSLEKVFKDLKRVHNIDIVATNDEIILSKRVNGVFSNDCCNLQII